MSQALFILRLPTADLVIDPVHEGGTKGNTADDVLGKLIPGAGNQAASVRSAVGICPVS